MRDPSHIIRGIRQTEKGARLERQNQFVLRVAPDANKIEIKQAAEVLFKVSVEHVNTQSYQGKWRRLTRRGGRRPDWKKAIVTVAKGQKIELK
jgi:large subunit ribosomal protein L23